MSIRHRGPDWSGVKVVRNNVMCHERLAIVGVDSGAQPLSNADETVFLCVNGEIYNHVELKSALTQKRKREGKPAPVWKTGSDCEVILHLYEEYGAALVNYLDGMYAFVLYDSVQDRYLATRDPIGIIPMYQGRGRDGSVWFASEMKCLFEDCTDSVITFEPGTLYDSRSRQTDRWYKPIWWDETWQPKQSEAFKALGGNDADMESIRGKLVIDENILIKMRAALEKSVEKHLMSEVPYGVLLSGGLDSSLIAAIAARCTQQRAHDAMVDSENELSSPSTPVDRGMWSPKLHSFSVGLPNSPDLLAARQVAKHIGTIHHEFTFTVQEGLDAIRDVIYHLETYDVTTVRASTPMYLMSRKIKATGVKMVLSGEGSDEVFGGYLYFHQAPTPKDLHVETVQRVKLLYTSDCLRANKSTMAWGLEARVPFLDLKYLEYSMTIPPEFKHPQLTPHRVEKELLRQAFDVGIDDGHGHMKPYLPEDILWRQKEQFSDGVGYSWIDSLKEHAVSLVSDEQFSERSTLFPYNTPTTKEAFYIRQVFEELYCPESVCPTNASKSAILKTVVKWVPRADWGCSEDPSGRAQKVHSDRYAAEVKK